MYRQLILSQMDLKVRSLFWILSFLCVQSSLAGLIQGDRDSSAMEGPIVTVKQGQLKGTIIQSSLNKPYIAFKGIPFAAPPVGNLRFQDPQPPASWTGVRDASKYTGEMCAQLDDYPPFQIFGGEDCLYLNVYAKSMSKGQPVMVWIHGGAYLSGSGTDFFVEPDYLVEKDVILVTVNYRLGAFGFLNLGHEVASGNQGFKDQVAALRWVKENIAVFGGDPENVTIFGASAGGGSVHLLSLSPMAAGLFQKAIAQSGSAIHPWGVDQSQPKRCFKLAKLLGKDSEDPKEVVEFLRTIPAHKIVEMQSSVLTNQEKVVLNLPFGPNEDSISQNPFLPQSIFESISNDNNITMMVGYTSREFIMFLKDHGETGIKRFEQLLPRHVQTCGPKVNPAKIPELTNEIKSYYFGDKNISTETLPGVIDLLSDFYFVRDSNVVVDHRRKRQNCAPTYLYRFSYVGNEETVTQTIMKNPPPVHGASHVDEMSYLFYMSRCKINNTAAPAIGTKDRITMERMTTLWTNFAKTGNPTPATDEYISTIWKPATDKDFNYLDIGDELEVKTIGHTVTDIFHKYS